LSEDFRIPYDAKVAHAMYEVIMYGHESKHVILKSNGVELMGYILNLNP
jgi:hypothetical protein